MRTLSCAEEVDARRKLGAPSVPAWLYPQVLSLDTAVIATGWQWIFAKSYGITFTSLVFWLTASSVWIIYLTDHLLDVRGGAPYSARHRFMRQHSSAFEFAIVVLLMVSAVAAVELPSAIRLGGLGLCAVVGFYLLAVHARAKASRRTWPKEIVVGANKENHHMRNLTPDVDFKPTAYADLRNVESGEGCVHCGTPLVVGKAVEIGHIFQLGYKYSESMGARVLDKDGKEVTPIMGSYGIGIERILTAAVEQGHDDNGFWLPLSIAPFDVVVVPISVRDETHLSTAMKIAEQLQQSGFDVIVDDRDERPGVKFKDADLVGIPFRVNVGKKVTEGLVEVKRRSTGETQDVNIAAISEHLQSVAHG